MRYCLTNDMKSAAPYLLKADLQKCGLRETNELGLALMFVKLHLPPPEIKILRPIFSEWSNRATRRPRCPTWAPQNSPAPPAPMISTSYSLQSDFISSLNL